MLNVISSACGYSSEISFKHFCDDDIAYVENIIRTELIKRLAEKCKRIGIKLTDDIKEDFFGDYATNIDCFKFGEKERTMLYTLADRLKEQNEDKLSSSQEIEIAKKI